MNSVATGSGVRDDLAEVSDALQALSLDDVQSMKVVELKAELAARGLSTTGVKKVLVDRLLESIDKDREAAVDNRVGRVDNSVKDIKHDPVPVLTGKNDQEGSFP